jgi:hypothetical protein
MEMQGRAGIQQWRFWMCRSLLVMCGACLLLASAASQAQTQRFAFSHGGFSEGAVLTGFFSGEDLDGDGKLSSLEGEVTDFAMHFSGNSRVAAFSIGFDELDGLVYFLNGGPLGDEDDPTRGEGIRARIGDLIYVIGPGPDETALFCGATELSCFISSGVAVDGSESLMQVTAQAAASPHAVPWSSWTWGWLMAVIMLVTWRGRRRRCGP